MAELLVNLVDNAADDPYADVILAKRGDVITVQEDGWGWGTEELANPEWTVLKFPNVTVESLDSLLHREKTIEPDRYGKTNRMLQHRGFYLDLDSLDFDFDNVELSKVIQKRAPRPDLTLGI